MYMHAFTIKISPAETQLSINHCRTRVSLVRRLLDHYPSFALSLFFSTRESSYRGRPYDHYSSATLSYYSHSHAHTHILDSKYGGYAHSQHQTFLGERIPQLRRSCPSVSCNQEMCPCSCCRPSAICWLDLAGDGFDWHTMFLEIFVRVRRPLNRDGRRRMTDGGVCSPLAPSGPPLLRHNEHNFGLSLYAGARSGIALAPKYRRRPRTVRCFLQRRRVFVFTSYTKKRWT